MERTEDRRRDGGRTKVRGGGHMAGKGKEEAEEGGERAVAFHTSGASWI